MRILYGLAGEGFGHSSRALSVIPYLIKKGHKVKVVTYGQAYSVLKDKFDVFKISGFSLIFEKNILKKRKTIGHNIKKLNKNLWMWKKFHKMMKEFRPDLCISDMEPIVPILRNWYKLPLICFDNQHRITNLKVKVPKKNYWDYIVAKRVVKLFVSKANYYIITSFTKTKIKKKYQKNTFIVAPIIRKDVQKIKPKSGNKILVYLTKKNKKVLKVLKNIKEEFVVYGYDINKKVGNLEFKKRENFLKDLAECKAIIASSGFTLMSESLFLKKPYLAVPLGGQFEQMLNALFLKDSGFGEYSEDLNEKVVNDFICNLNFYKKNLKNYNADYNYLHKVLDKVLDNFKVQL